MRFPRLAAIPALLIAATLLSAPAAPAQETKDVQDKAAIEHVLHQQEQDWNHGDVEAFMHGYKDSPDTIFIGKVLRRGYRPIFERYTTSYPNRDAMGTLTFADLSIRMLGPGYAVATGSFHLARSAAGGGEASGIFSLIFEREPTGWQIILDHTSQNTN